MRKLFIKLKVWILKKIFRKPKYRVHPPCELCRGLVRYFCRCQDIYMITEAWDPAKHGKYWDASKVKTREVRHMEL